MKKIFLILSAIFISTTYTFAVDYSQFDVNDINAANKAVKAYHEEFKDKRRTKEADEELEKFWDFYLQFENAQSDKIYLPYTTVNGSIAKQIKIYSKQYYKYGLIAQFDEGEFFIVPSRKYLYRNFRYYVTKEKQALMKFDTQFDERVVSDLRFIVPKSKIESYIKFYKKFYKKYPEYSKTHNIDEFIKYYEDKLINYPNI